MRIQVTTYSGESFYVEVDKREPTLKDVREAYWKKAQKLFPTFKSAIVNRKPIHDEDKVGSLVVLK